MRLINRATPLLKSLIPMSTPDARSNGEPRPIGVVVVEGYPPAHSYGGPAVSSANLVEATKSLVDWRVITRNDDIGREQGRRLAPEAQWIGADPVLLRTNSYPRMSLELVRLLRREKVRLVVANSLFAPSTRSVLLSTALWPELRPVVLPRGELDPGALAINPRRKRLFIAFLKALGQDRRVCFAATSDLERRNVARVFPGGELRILPCIPVSPDRVPFQARPPGATLRLVFNSRISPKKGLHLAVAAVNELPDDWDVTYDIYGSVESDYGRHCINLAQKGPHPERFRWLGIHAPADILIGLGEYHAMLLPTQGENFGHAIFEALAAGTPVLIPDTTPWTATVRAGAGMLLETLTGEAVTCRLAGLRMQDSDQQLTMRRAARAAALSYYKGVHELVSVAVLDLLRAA